MAVGDRIKRARNFRGLTQKELGIAAGLDERSADIRIAQYESGTRTPKEDLLRKIAEVLDVNYRSLYEVTDTSDPDYPELHMALSFRNHLLDGFLKEWQLRKQQLADGEITQEEYLEWKLNWPQTADGCGKHTPVRRWRKSE